MYTYFLNKSFLKRKTSTGSITWPNITDIMDITKKSPWGRTLRNPPQCGCVQVNMQLQHSLAPLILSLVDWYIYLYIYFFFHIFLYIFKPFNRLFVKSPTKNVGCFLLHWNTSDSQNHTLYVFLHEHFHMILCIEGSGYKKCFPRALSLSVVTALTY